MTEISVAVFCSYLCKVDVKCSQLWNAGICMVFALELLGKISQYSEKPQSTVSALVKNSFDFVHVPKRSAFIPFLSFPPPSSFLHENYSLHISRVSAFLASSMPAFGMC